MEVKMTTQRVSFQDLLSKGRQDLNENLTHPACVLLPFLPALSQLLPVFVLSSLQLRAQNLMNKVDKEAATFTL